MSDGVNHMNTNIIIQEVLSRSRCPVVSVRARLQTPGLHPAINPGEPSFVSDVPLEYRTSLTESDHA